MLHNKSLYLVYIVYFACFSNVLESRVLLGFPNIFILIFYEKIKLPWKLIPKDSNSYFLVISSRGAIIKWRKELKWNELFFDLSEIYYDSHCIILPVVVLDCVSLGFYRAELLNWINDWFLKSPLSNINHFCLFIS